MHPSAPLLPFAKSLIHGVTKGAADARLLDTLYFDATIKEISESEIYEPSVKKLKAFKGLDILGAMILIAEITDFRRFPNPGALMAFLGLIPSENSSGNKQKGGGITKTGNHRCRKQLIESVQHLMKKPVISYKMKSNLQEVDPDSANIAIKCMNRLHKRFWALMAKGKSRNKARTVNFLSIIL